MPFNTKVAPSSWYSPHNYGHKYTDTAMVRSDLAKVTTRGDLSYLIDEVDTVDCRTCITTGNKVSLLIKVSNGRESDTDGYMWVDNDHIVIKLRIADPDSTQVLFDWINLPSVRDAFAFMLQNGYQVVGVERFTDGEPLTLQLKESNNQQHYYMYKHSSGDYFSLHLKSPDGHFYYILPINGKLRIYREDTIKNNLQHHDLFVFRIGSYQCSNLDGPCPFARMMQKRIS